MTVGERIKELRKDVLHRTLEQFGDTIKLGKSALSAMENNQRGVTDQTILSICREFNVREEWLRTGEGEPFKELGREEQIADYFRDLEGLNDELKKRLVSALAAIGEEDWKIIRDLVEKIVRDNAEPVGNEPPSADPAAPDPDIAKLPPDEQELVRQYREKKLPAGGSGATAAG